MKLEILISETACFYYWIQAVSNWDPHAVDKKTYDYYTSTLSAEHMLIADKIKTILQGIREPRWILAELYSNNTETSEAREIAAISKHLTSAFKPLWKESLPHLEKWRGDLVSTNFTEFATPLQEVIDFLDSSFDLQNTRVLYLILNPPGHRAAGLVINETNFILVRPSNTGEGIGFNNTISVITHEYIHAIEQRSKKSRELFKDSYDRYIRINNIPTPVGYTWKMVYTETLAYCFASTVIRGYLSPEIYGKLRPTISEMEDGFQRLLKKDEHTTLDIINWVALNILPQVEEYIKYGKKIDRHITNRMGELFLGIYLT